MPHTSPPLHEEHYLPLSLNYNLIMAFEAHHWMQDNPAFPLQPQTFSVPFGILKKTCDGSLLLTLVQPVNDTLDSYRETTAQIWWPLLSSRCLSQHFKTLLVTPPHTVQQSTQCISKLLCNFCLVIHPCNTAVWPHGCIIPLQATSTPCECVHFSPSPLSPALSGENSKITQKKDFLFQKPHWFFPRHHIPPHVQQQF